MSMKNTVRAERVEALSFFVLSEKNKGSPPTSSGQAEPIL